MKNELKGKVGVVGKSSRKNVQSPGGCSRGGGTCAFEELKGSQRSWREECGAGRCVWGGI